MIPSDLLTFKAAIRAGAIKTIKKGTGRGSLEAAESHAKREDLVSQKRVVRPSEPIAWSKADGLKGMKTTKKGEPAVEVTFGSLDYVEAFKAHKKATGASERKGADLAIEFKVVVSPEWLAEDGADPRDRNNPRVQQLVAEAQAWAESWGGKNSVWAVRYDTDEAGAGVVDLFMSPVREQRHKNGSSKLVISCRKAKQELLEAERVLEPELRNSGAAMQSSWARWCQEKLDPRIERGISKEETGREHVHAEVYAKEANKALNLVKIELDLYTERLEELKEEAERLKRHSHSQADQITRKAVQEASQIRAEARQEGEAEAEEIKAAAYQQAESIKAKARGEASDLMGRAIVAARDALADERRKISAERVEGLDAMQQRLVAENERLTKEVQRLRPFERFYRSLSDTLLNMWGEALQRVVADRAGDVVKSFMFDWLKSPYHPDNAAKAEREAKEAQEKAEYERRFKRGNTPGMGL